MHACFFVIWSFGHNAEPTYPRHHRKEPSFLQLAAAAAQQPTALERASTRVTTSHCTAPAIPCQSSSRDAAEARRGAPQRATLFTWAVVARHGTCEYWRATALRPPATGVSPLPQQLQKQTPSRSGGSIYQYGPLLSGSALFCHLQPHAAERCAPSGGCLKFRVTRGRLARSRLGARGHARCRRDRI